MQINNLKRKIALKKPQAVGRGGKRGKTSGRGTKGQKARSGNKIRPEIRDIIKKIPKLRGRGMNINTSIQAPFFVVSIAKISENYKNGDTVTVTDLVSKGLVRKVSGKIPRVKITGGSELKEKINFSGVAFTASAKDAITKSGGKIS